MKNKLFAGLLAAVLLFPVLAARAQSDPSADLKDLVQRISADLHAGKNTVADQAGHLQEFDALLLKYKGQTNDDVANIVMFKAMLYLEVFKDYDKGAEVLKDLQREFPNSKPAQNVDKLLAIIKAGEAARKIQAGLVVGTAFPDFTAQDVDGKPLSVSEYKGKVVLVDFWATWCPPCVADVPYVVSAYKKYHDKGFEIIGVSLDKDGDKDKMLAFTKDHEMAWRQYYDGKYWTNQLAVKYGVQSIPATFLLDGTGKIIGRDFRGDALEPAVAKALEAKAAGPSLAP